MSFVFAAAKIVRGVVFRCTVWFRSRLAAVQYVLSAVQFWPYGWFVLRALL